MTNRPAPSRTLILGLGLIGGSLALAVRRAGAPGRLWGLDRDPGHLAEALRLGLVDQAWDPGAAPEPFDRVLLAVPPGQIRAALGGLGPWLRPDTQVLDACSVKAPVLLALREVLGQHPFVPCHPIAGSHLAGPGAARADLFEGCTVVLTPEPDCDPALVQRAEAFWRRLGAQVRRSGAEDHDQALGLLSHLPHLLAFTYAQLLARREPDLTLAGPGFQDFTRIAQGSPALWADIALANGAVLRPLLRELGERLATLERQLAEADRPALVADWTLASSLLRAALQR